MSASERLRVECVTKSFGEVTAVNKLSIHLRAGEVLGLVGPNGAGKTTLFDLISGVCALDSGSIHLYGCDTAGLPPYRIAQLGIGRMFQELRLIRQITVLENVMLSFPHQIGERLTSVALRWGSVRNMEKRNRCHAEKILSEVGLLDKRDSEAKALSYGQQKLLSIACLQATSAGLLLMDEPIAGITPEMVRTILLTINNLSVKGTAIMLIDHDLNAVSSVCRRIVFLDAGRMAAEGTPEEIRSNPDVIKAYLE